MKIVFAVMILTASALAQGPSFSLAPSCGPKGINFNVKLDTSPHPMKPVESMTAMVYFIQDDGPLGMDQHFTVKIGMAHGWALTKIIPTLACP